jgi:hypothetical protein
MKKYYILIVILLFIGSLNAYTNAASMALADSYSLRAKGIETGYWNPANLYDSQETGYELYLLNAGISLASNFLSVSLYNEINGDSLTISKRKNILNKFDKSLQINANMKYSLLGYSFNQHSISIGLTINALGKLSKQYLDLLLLGNTETYNHNYTFSKKNNGFHALSYADMTYASSSKTLNDIIPSLDYVQWLPDIKIGYSFSAILGISEADITKYDSHFSTNDSTGIHLDQEIKGRYGLGGYGMKLKFGMKSQVYDNLQVGITFDNLIGFVKWVGKTETVEFNVSTDSVFIADLSDNFITQNDTTYSIGSFETTLPTIFHFGTLYKYNKASFSLDWNQNFGPGIFYSTEPEVSLGSQYYVLPYLPLRLGFAFGNNDRNYKFTYGLGYEIDRFSLDIGFESVSQIFPNSDSKNISFGITSKLKW